MRMRPRPGIPNGFDRLRAALLALGLLSAVSCGTSGRLAIEDPEVLAMDPARACALGHARACTRAGMTRLAADDPAGGTSLFERGCELEDSAACNVLADLTNLGLVGEPEPATELYERACTLGAKPACQTLEAKGQVWFSLPPELVFDEYEAPDPKVEMPMGRRETLRVVVAICVRDGRKPAVVLRSSSMVGGLDDAVIDTMSGWRFSVSPRVRPDTALCKSWAFSFHRAPESPHDEWRSRQRHGAGSD